MGMARSQRVSWELAPDIHKFRHATGSSWWSHKNLAPAPLAQLASNMKRIFTVNQMHHWYEKGFLTFYLLMEDVLTITHTVYARVTGVRRHSFNIWQITPTDGGKPKTSCSISDHVKHWTHLKEFPVVQHNGILSGGLFRSDSQGCWCKHAILKNINMIV